MAVRPGGIMVMQNGSLAAAVCAAMARADADAVRSAAADAGRDDPGPSIDFLVMPPGSAVLPSSPPNVPAAAREAAIAQQADLAEARALIRAAAIARSDAEAPAGAMFPETVELLAAAAHAAIRGCERLVWPLAAGDDLDALTLAGERIATIEQLLALDLAGSVGRGSGRTLAIDAPLLDMTAEQLHDLARDHGIPTAAYTADHALIAAH